jgi:hypothetical protein
MYQGEVCRKTVFSGILSAMGEDVSFENPVLFV